MICPQCRKEIENSADVCPSCGVSTKSGGEPVQSNRIVSKIQEYSFLLIPVIFFMVVLLGLFIYNSNRKVKVLDRYFLSIKECDMDDFYYSIFSHSIIDCSVDEYYDEYSQTDSLIKSIYYSLSKDDYITSIVQQSCDIERTLLYKMSNDLNSYYGDGYQITYKIKKMEQMNANDLDELENYYKSTYPALCYSYDSGYIRQGKKVKLEYTIEGSKSSFTNVCTINIYRTVTEGWLIDKRILDHMPLYAN